MTTDQLEERLKAKPFTPFTIRMTDGRKTRITHPEACAYRGGQVFAYMHPDNRVEVIDLLLVSSLLIESPNGPGEPEGDRKRKPKGGGK